MEQVALYLRVDLSEDVGCFAHVEGAPDASCDHLGGDLEFVEELLVLGVVLLHPQNHDHDLGMPKDCLGSSHHVVHKLSFSLDYVPLIVKLDKVRLTHSDLQLIACLSEGVVDLVSDIVVGASGIMLVHHNPLLVTQVDGLLDRHSFERLLVAHHHLV